MSELHELPVTAYLVLGLLAEGEAHGYELQRKIHDRGFRFWTQIQRASIYNALKRLETLGLLTSELTTGGGGPARKVFRITDEGRRRFREESRAYLATPDHPRDELDLGALGMPYLGLADSRRAVDEAEDLLRQREAFVSERLAWCRQRGLELPGLSFDRALRAIRADLDWLGILRGYLDDRSDPPAEAEWESYEYLLPPYVEEDD